MVTMFLKAPCAHCHKRMSYHLHYVLIKDRLWSRACKVLGVDKSLVLCRPCMEKGIGRPLRQRDLTQCPVNEGVFGFNKEHLMR